MFAGVLVSIVEGTAVAQTAPAATQSFPTVEPPPVAPSAAASNAQPATSASAPAAPEAALPRAPEPTAPTSAPSTQPAAAAPPVAARPNWNLGAGILAGDSAGVGSLYLLGGSPGTPVYRLSLERRIHRHTWLSLTGSFVHTSSDVPVSSSMDPPTRTSIDYQFTSATALLGVRQAFVTDLVELSLFAAAVGGWSWTGGDRLQAGESASLASAPGASARTLGLTSGIAVERELIPQLAVRLSSEVITLQWSKTTPAPDPNQTDGTEPVTHHSQLTVVHFAPALDLRFYF